MKRKSKLVIILLLAVIVLTGCSQKKEEFEVYGQSSAQNPTSTPVVQVQITAPAQSVMDQNPYEQGEWFEEDQAAAALNEEQADQQEAAAYAASLENTVYPFAGATPLPLDPIDLPTPTPKPELNFTYVDYTSASLGVTFKAPAGWMMDESQPQLCILSEPDHQMKDGQLCIITISVEPVNSTYKQSELKTHVQQRLDSLYTSDFDSFSPSLTATRNMLGAKGVYANYSGVLNNGVKVGGRILYASANNRLYGLEILYPHGFKGSFEDVFGQVRSSMSLIK